MRVSYRTAATAALCGVFLVAPERLPAKGLDELSESNPETTEDETASDASADTEDEAASEEAPKTPEETEKKQPKENEDTKKEETEEKAEQTEEKPAEDTAEETGKEFPPPTGQAFLNTSFGWAWLSRSKGEWDANGMSDITLGWKIPWTPAEPMIVYGTYRYAPIGVTMEAEKNGITRSYRGVVENHLLGARVDYPLASLPINVVGSFELGRVEVNLHPVDGFSVPATHEADGETVVLGGGADWSMLGTKGLEVGPRVMAGFGHVTAFQLAGSARYLF